MRSGDAGHEINDQVNARLLAMRGLSNRGRFYWLLTHIPEGGNRRAKTPKLVGFSLALSFAATQVACRFERVGRGERVPHNTKTPSAECFRVEEVKVPITSDTDITLARQRARKLASEADFTAVESAKITAVVSELAHNILQYAGRGEIVLSSIHQEDRTGVMVVARDKGPGISNVRNALQDGFSSNAGLGLGLPLVRRLMDEFEIAPHQDHGTTVIVKKWARECMSGRLETTAGASFTRRDSAAGRMLAAVGSATR
jgi:serine/threonine-protein kinase RsbT